jgi:purine nucleosidase
MTIKLLLDTDIGSDIDDAVCLAYLLANPQCELLGITTVSGEPEKRAMLASVLCKIAGKNIPIFPGAEKPFLVAPQQRRAQQAAALKKWPHETQFPKGQAVQFLRETIYQHPGEITLLTIGPLTNIALLFTLDPEIPAMLKALVMMCGLFTKRFARGDLEWNALLDPHATAIVYQQNTSLHQSLGLDVTTQVTMESAEVRNRFQADLLRPVLDFAEIWFQQTNVITFHDPLAGATIFNDQICQMQRGTVTVELTSERLQGFTYWSPDPLSGRHQIAVSVNQDKFFEEFFSVFG